MQVQIQTLLAAGEGGAGGMERRMMGSNMGPHVERERSSKGSRAEEAGARREDDRKAHTRV